MQPSGGQPPEEPAGNVESWMTKGRLRKQVKKHSYLSPYGDGDEDSDPFLYTRRKMARSQGRKRRRIGTSLQIANNSRPVDELAVSQYQLRRSTRKRRPSLAIEDYDLSGKGISTEDDDGRLRKRRVRTRRRVVDVEEIQEDDDDDEEEEPGDEDEEEGPGTQDLEENEPELEPEEATPPPRQPRRQGLRPRTALQPNGGMENGGHEAEEPEEEESMSGEEPEEEEEGEERDEGEEPEEGEEDEQRQRRYALRNRTEVQRFSPRREERTTRLRSPKKREYHSLGGGGASKRNRGDGRRPRSGAHKRRHTLCADDSEDSLLIDEIEKGAWGRSGPRLPKNAWVPPLAEVPLTPGLGWATGANVWSSQDILHAGAPQPVAAGGATAPKAGADIQPVAVDPSVTFESIGGLSEHIDALKEMVFFPLLYPDFFAKYHITPPRGVLLCGPPGTGKTLTARALASAASKSGQRVTFYMRKGADVLSKWVGEAERQLKLLFEEAQRNQPSIIFFDEIDGLAPCRSSKQEQIHNSIVSTLLALMDGLDSRGQVVVLGATNRVDAIDSALRRPGRFDREFVFPLPDVDARAEILTIHTRKWEDPPSDGLRRELAETCVGYCGADLKALCTEAAILAFRKKYPQVYSSDEPFIIDVESIKVERQHFLEAMSSITPATHRSAVVHARPLPPLVAPLLAIQLNTILKDIKETYPAFTGKESDDADDVWGPEEVGIDSGVEQQVLQLSRLFAMGARGSSVFVQRPRLLLCGKKGAGQDHIGPAILHDLEQFPVHSLGLPSLLADKSAKTPEEALVHIVGEARRNTPAVLYLPHLQLWWDTADDPLRATLMMLLSDLPPALPLLLLGTADVNCDMLDPEARSLFGRHVKSIPPSTATDRANFFSPALEAAVAGYRPNAGKTQKEKPPELPKAPKVEKGPTDAELQLQAATEEHALRRLRMCLRDVCNRLLNEKRFALFHYPLSEDDFPDYKQVVQRPMDVTALLQNVDAGFYLTRPQFLGDVDLIASNAKEYFGEEPQSVRLVSKAHALRDAVHIMLSQLDQKLVDQCEEIAAKGGPVKAPGFKSTLSPSPYRAMLPPVTRASARLRGEKAEVNVHRVPEQARGRGRRSTDKGQAEGFKQEQSERQEAEPGAEQREGTEQGPEKEVQETGGASGSGQEARGQKQEDVEMQDAEAKEEGDGAQPAEKGKGEEKPDEEKGGGDKDDSPGPSKSPKLDINQPVSQAEPSERSAQQGDNLEKEKEEDPKKKEEYMTFVRGLKDILVQKTAHMSVEGLEAVNASLCRLVHAHREENDRWEVLYSLEAFIKDNSNFVEEEVIAVDHKH